MSKILAHLPLICLLSLLLIPALDRKLHFLPVYPETEKRDLAPRPTYSLRRGIPTMMTAFEAYWNDNFGGRSLLINTRANLWIKLFHDSPLGSVVIGDKGWLFYESEAKDDGPGINDYQGLTPFTEAELTGVVDSIVAEQAKLKKQGITLEIVVAPNKSTIYPEYLPVTFPKLGSTTRLDQLKAALPKDILFVDLRDALRAGKSQLPTYQMTDSHWNSYGAFLGASTLIHALPSSYHLKPLELSGYALKTQTVNGEGDLASMMAARGIFTDRYIGLSPKTKTVFTDYDFGYARGLYAGHVWQQPKSKLPRLLLFGDSFRALMEPFLIQDFSTSYIMGFTANYKLNDDLIKLAKPNIVIWEVAERYVDRLKQ